MQWLKFLHGIAYGLNKKASSVGGTFDVSLLTIEETHLLFEIVADKKINKSFALNR